MPKSSRPRIIIVGLGPGDPKHLTVEAQGVLRRARRLYLRTRRHPVVAHLPSHLELLSFDEVYDQAASFAEVYETIANRLLDQAEANGLSPVIYAVPGHPLVAEESVHRLLDRACARSLPVRIVDGLSFLAPTFTLLKLDPLAQGLQVLDATELASFLEAAEKALPTRRPFDATRPAVIAQLYSRQVASHVKLALMRSYSPEHQVTLVKSAGVPGEEATRAIPLHDLDRQPDVDHLTCLYVPPISQEEDLRSFESLRYIVARLRAPGGCPWDREQTHLTLRPHLIEEAYEVLDALEGDDPAKLAEEMGDLLLQIMLHAQLAAEEGTFDVDDVVAEISAKLIRRHPHVFGSRHVKDATEVLRNWEQIKRTEERAPESIIGGVPRHLPALAYAQTVGRKVARVGFDWPDQQGVVDKIAEEVGELTRAGTLEEKRHELGDLLLAIVNLARWLGIDAEDALREANHRFAARFQRVEALAAQRGLDLSEMSIQQLDELWEEAKAEMEGDGGPREQSHFGA